LPEDLSRIGIVRVPPKKLGKGFSAKLNLDELSPAQQTLFIDADCLIFGDLTSVFDRFAGRAVSVVGGSISSGEWFGDVAEICSRFKVQSLPKFNGGIYYFEQGEVANSVYQQARNLEGDYDRLGLVRLRGRPNDELLMAIAMARHAMKSLPDDGSIMSDPQSCPGEMSVDVLRGHSRLVNPPAPDKRHQPDCPHELVSPLVVHFLGDHTREFQYRAEQKKLSLVMGRGWGIAWARLFVVAFITVPQKTLALMKKGLRPIFHRIFGPRRVARSERI